jgi:hypothetical protein
MDESLIGNGVHPKLRKLRPEPDLDRHMAFL